jgi:hypothetical protein
MREVTGLVDYKEAVVFNCDVKDTDERQPKNTPSNTSSSAQWKYP